MADDTKLTAAEFAAKIKAKFPQYADISDDELTQKIVSKHPEYADKVILTQAAPSGTTPENMAAVEEANKTNSPYPMISPAALPGVDPRLEKNITGSRALTPEEKAKENEVFKQGMPMLAANVASEGAASLPLLARLSITGATAGLTSAVAGGDKGDVAASAALGAGGELGGAAVKFGAEKASAAAQQSLARLLRLSPKAFQFGREPAEEVLKEGISGMDLSKLVDNIGQASRETTSKLNSLLEKSPGTVSVFDAATAASHSIPNPTAANRFEQVVLDSADKLGLKNLDKLTNAEANSLKQEVARQGKFVEGDLRPMISNAIKQFGGKVKDRIVANVPEAQQLLESSANLTEASKGGERAVRMEKAGQGKSGLSSVDIKRPSTYPRVLTDTMLGSKTLFRAAQALQDSGITASGALRMAFNLVYPEHD